MVRSNLVHFCERNWAILRRMFPSVSPGTAFIFSDIFDEYVYRSEHPQNGGDDDMRPTQFTQYQEVDNVAFEVPLNTVIDCLNIFGTAGPAPSGNTKDGGNKRWRKRNEGSDHDSGDEGRGRRIEPLSAVSEKQTGMRMTYTGSGYPLTLLMCGITLFLAAHRVCF